MGVFHTIVDQSHGSSGKGAVSARLVDINPDIKNVSACNFPNAGHCVVHNGRKYVFKTLPSASILNKIKNRNLGSWIGPNSGLKITQLADEVSMVGLTEKVFIHDRSIIVEDRHSLMEKSGNQSTLRIASTMSGSGAAYSEKSMRQSSVFLAKNALNTVNNWDFFQSVHKELEHGDFFHEVSQGFALSTDWGTHYPYCTFRNCTPQQAYADMGILPHQVGDVYLNIRTFPIRVGNVYDENGLEQGYSGDFMEDAKETTWEEIAKNAEMPPGMSRELLNLEKTTVTKRVRRVFTFSWKLLEISAKFCGATKLVVNFPQYLHWSAYGIKGGRAEYKSLHSSVKRFVEKCENVTNLPVVMIGTSAEHEDYIYLD